MRKKKVSSHTMADVASRAGVSLSTVSRALSGSELISEETTRLVLQSAASLNYCVDAAGSSLRTGLTRTVAVVIPLAHAAKQNLSDPFFLDMIGALADELSAAGYSMLLSKVTGDPAEWIASAIRTRRADGIIVIGQSLHHRALNKLAASDIPMVVWGSKVPRQRYISVGSDNVAGGRLATEHLISQGCRNIVFIGDPAVPEVAARLDGYKSALSDAGIKSNPQLEISVQFGSDTTYDAINSLLDAKVKFEGIVACSDVLAMSALSALAERGCRIPADVAIVGFDDIPFAAFTAPPLTTVRQNCHTGARLLVEKLMNTIQSKSDESATLPVELVVRASSLREQFKSVSLIQSAKNKAKNKSVRSSSDRRTKAS